jgi:hypothetical protein
MAYFQSKQMRFQFPDLSIYFCLLFIYSSLGIDVLVFLWASSPLLLLVQVTQEVLVALVTIQDSHMTPTQSISVYHTPGHGVWLRNGLVSQVRPPGSGLDL